jgi:CheY-like chemotaxis protein
MSTLRKPSILVIDDNEATCTLVTAVLQNEFHVTVAGGGAEAIERLKTDRCSTVLLDLKMPGVDGYAVLDFLREHRPELLPHVIIFTAALSKREMARISEFPICSIVRKPFEIEQLLEAVRQCCRSDETRGVLRVLPATGTVLMLVDLISRVTPR